ncbi:hypothetical protein Mgra_00002533 [Meloidogyne graminicola]|uniref:Uncharacterized protein n=1 Tax=Meloidogyne graminicola TaxID=189291 RepID=A0A8S9ZWP1_9BILA|nr:hypothetical protein Mgra_00002533 [Meloidogyne graminicola]
MASDLESSILREHAEKLEKEKASILSDESNKTFDLLAALGIQPSNNKDVVGDKTISETKLPNSDAEFAACILGLPIDQIAKIMPNMLPSVNTEPQQQQDQPTTSRLIRWQKATLNAAKSENNLSRIGDEELKMALKRDLMVNDDSRMNKNLLPPRGQFIPNGQQPFVFNPPIGGPYGGGNQFQGGVHHFQNVGPSHHNNFVLPPYAAVPFTSSQQQFFPPFGSSTGLNHPNYNQNRQQSPFNPMNNPLHFPPPLVNPQQQMSAHHQNLINSPAFMPTSVMRQMSKMPGCGSSVNSGGDSTSVGGATLAAAATGLSSSNTSALLQKMFAEAKRNESQQQQTQSTGRAILGCDPNLEIGFLSPTEAQGSNPS